MWDRCSFEDGLNYLRVLIVIVEIGDKDLEMLMVILCFNGVVLFFGNIYMKSWLGWEVGCGDIVCLKCGKCWGEVLKR